MSPERLKEIRGNIRIYDNRVAERDVAELLAEIHRLNGLDPRYPKTHELKCWPQYFEPLKSRHKMFEIRRNDRDFHVGDVLHLNEWNPGTLDYTGRIFVAYVSYITGFAQQEGFVVLGLSVV